MPAISRTASQTMIFCLGLTVEDDITEAQILGPN